MPETFIEEIKSCPYCYQLYKNYNMISADYGQIIYSDGYIKGIQKPHISIIKCANICCNKFINLDKCPIICSRSSWNIKDTMPEELNNNLLLRDYEMTFTQLGDALESEFVANRENEIEIRMLLLRRYNDVFRKDRKNDFSDEERESFLNNIEILIDLFKYDDTVEGKLFLSELFREKSDFESCIEILRTISNETEREKEFKKKIYSRAKVKDNKVFAFQNVIIKKEYLCKKCGHSTILFDLESNKYSFEYKHFRCNDENIIFDSPTKKINPHYYSETSNIWQRLYYLVKPKLYLHEINEIVCPSCNGVNTEIYNPETEMCVKCREDKYFTVKWYE